MYTPHTVTVYNVLHETDPATFEDTDSVNITILRGVFLDASKATNVRQSGLVSADAVNLYIPFGVNATDGTSGTAKSYAKPQAYWSAQDRRSLWTLSFEGNGGETFFIKGEVVLQDLNAARAHDDCYVVTKVDEKDYGSPDMQHWEVGGA